MIDESLNNDCVTTSVWQLTLSPGERSQLDMLVSMFTVYKDLKIFASPRTVE
jgi:hypothetical protein